MHQDSEGQVKQETSESSDQGAFKKAPKVINLEYQKGQKLKEGQLDENKNMNQNYWLSWFASCCCDKNTMT